MCQQCLVTVYNCHTYTSQSSMAYIGRIWVTIMQGRCRDMAWKTNRKRARWKIWFFLKVFLTPTSAIVLKTLTIWMFIIGSLWFACRIFKVITLLHTSWLWYLYSLLTVSRSSTYQLPVFLITWGKANCFVGENKTLSPKSPQKLPPLWLLIWKLTLYNKFWLWWPQILWTS